MIPRSGLVAVATAMLLAGCGAGAGEQDDGGPTLNVGVDSENFMTNMPLYVGLEKGFFKEAGIDELNVTVTGDQFASALLSGSVDIAHGSTTSWLAAGEQSGEPIRWIASLRDAEYLQLGVRPGINSVEDLRGKKVTGGPAGSANEANLRIVLEELGLSPDDVEIVPTNPGSDGWLQAVLAGQLDGAMLFARHIGPLEDGGGKFLYQERHPRPQDGFATTQDFLDKSSDTVRAFLVGLLKAKKFYKDIANRDEVLDIMRRKGFDPSVVERAYELEIGQQSDDGGFNVEEMDELLERAIAIEEIPAGTDWRKWVSLDALWAAQQEVGMQKRPAVL